MTRKKHTHQTKSEAHAEEAARSNEAATFESEADSNAFQRASVAANGRFRRIVRSAEDLAKKRLQGTRAELMLDGLPVRMEKALDALLDRVGLVRKSKLEGNNRSAPNAAAQPA